MSFIGKLRYILLIAILLGFGGGQDAAYGASTPTIQWPADTINFSQLERLFSQYPGSSQLNLQFPNQLNWSVTPATVQSLLNTYQQQAQSVGLSTVPGLGFTSLGSNSRQQNINQFSISGLNGNVPEQMEELLRQWRYQEMNMSDWMPDWAKNICLMIYDAVYGFFDYMGNQIASLAASAAR